MSGFDHFLSEEDTQELAVFFPKAGVLTFQTQTKLVMLNTDEALYAGVAHNTALALQNIHK